MRPSEVTGNLSPYPTVVIVTNAHQMASSTPLMLASGTSGRRAFLGHRGLPRESYAGTSHRGSVLLVDTGVSRKDRRSSL